MDEMQRPLASTADRARFAALLGRVVPTPRLDVPAAVASLRVQWPVAP